MLLIKTKLGASKTHGIGVFAAERIIKGTPMWKFKTGFDLQLTLEELNNLSEPAREQALNYSYQDTNTGKYILCGDDARFYNHSKNPNTGPDPNEPDDYLDIALRNIEKGEEIVCDYFGFYGNT